MPVGVLPCLWGNYLFELLCPLALHILGFVTHRITTAPRIALEAERFALERVHSQDGPKADSQHTTIR